MTFRLPAELQRALRDIAHSRGENLNQLVERALREFIDSASESLPPPREIDLSKTAMIPELELPPYTDELPATPVKPDRPKLMPRTN